MFSTDPDLDPDLSLAHLKNVKTRSNFAKLNKVDTKIPVTFNNLFFKRPLKCKILNFF